MLKNYFVKNPKMKATFIGLTYKEFVGKTKIGVRYTYRGTVDLKGKPHGLGIRDIEGGTVNIGIFFDDIHQYRLCETINRKYLRLYNMRNYL